MHVQWEGIPQMRKRPYFVLVHSRLQPMVEQWEETSSQAQGWVIYNFNIWCSWEHRILDWKKPTAFWFLPPTAIFIIFFKQPMLPHKVVPVTSFYKAECSMEGKKVCTKVLMNTVCSCACKESPCQRDLVPCALPCIQYGPPHDFST